MRIQKKIHKGRLSQAWATLEKISNMQMTAKASYDFYRNMNSWLEVIQQINKKLLDLMVIYNKPMSEIMEDEKGKEEYLKIMTEEIELTIREIPISGLKGQISAHEIKLVEFMLCEDESIIVLPNAKRILS